MSKAQFQPQDDPLAKGALSEVDTDARRLLPATNGDLNKLRNLFTAIFGSDIPAYVAGQLVDSVRGWGSAYIVLTTTMRNVAITTAQVLSVHRDWIWGLARITIPKLIDQTRAYAHGQVAIESRQRKTADIAIVAYASLRARQVQHHADVAIAALLAFTMFELKLLSNLVHSLFAQAIAYTDKRIAEEHAYANQVLFKSLTYTDRQIAATFVYINDVIAQARAYALQQATIAQAKAEKYTDAQLALLNKTVSDAYDKTRSDQATGISKVLDVVVAYNPEIRSVIGLLAKAILDLAEIDDPLIRVAATVLLRQVVDHIGIDTAVGAFVNDIVSLFIGRPVPRTVATVAADIGGRLNSLEAQWQSFLANGGQEIEDLGDDLHELHSPVFLAVILGLITAEIADPSATARAVNDVIGGPVNAIGTQLANILSLTGIA